MNIRQYPNARNRVLCICIVHSICFVNIFQLYLMVVKDHKSNQKFIYKISSGKKIRYSIIHE